MTDLNFPFFPYRDLCTNAVLHASELTPQEQRTANVARFMVFYRPALEAAAAAKPDDYPWYAAKHQSVEAVAERMRLAFVKGSYNHDGAAIKRACKAVGIKHTRKAMEAFFNGEQVQS